MKKKDIVHLVNQWADWVVRVSEGSALGYPRETVEAKLMQYAGRVDSRPAGPIVPDLPMPRHIVDVDRAVREMERNQHDVLMWHHLGPGNTCDKVRVYCERVEMGQRKYYSTLDNAYSFVDGWVSVRRVG